MNLASFVIFFSIVLFASEGYPPRVVEIILDSKENAIIRNFSCFGLTVSVNGKDYYISPGDKQSLNQSNWGDWFWIPGRIGKMDELNFSSPLSDKFIPDFGPNDVQTHVKEKEFSYDFSVMEGTPIYAMESGTVIRVIDHYTIAHQDLKRLNQVNLVEILHEDGSIATYAHHRPQSARVRICQKIGKGQLLALSGNTGFSSGPHLHVDVARPIGQKQFKTIPIKFQKR